MEESKNLFDAVVRFTNRRSRVAQLPKFTYAFHGARNKERKKESKEFFSRSKKERKKVKKKKKKKGRRK